jgi:hypothetical protein
LDFKRNEKLTLFVCRHRQVYFNFVINGVGDRQLVNSFQLNKKFRIIPQ